jgi:uncharacterized protein
MPTPHATLSDDEQQALATSVQRVREATVRAARGPDAPPPFALVQWLHAGLASSGQRAAERLAARDRALACRAGCAACCSSRVELGFLEARVLVRHLARQDEAWKQVVRERLDAHAALMAERIDKDAIRPPCVLLDDEGRCSVYEARPAVCRKGHSLDAQACHERRAEIPQDLGLLLDAEALILGVEAASNDLGLGGPRRELTEVVREALA